MVRLAVFLAIVIWALCAAALIMDERQKASPYKWRQCAPAQDGLELVSTTQWPDHTDCFYQQQKKGRVPARKDTAV